MLSLLTPIIIYIDRIYKKLRSVQQLRDHLRRLACLRQHRHGCLPQDIIDRMFHHVPGNICVTNSRFARLRILDHIVIVIDRML